MHSKDEKNNVNTIPFPFIRKRVTQGIFCRIQKKTIKKENLPILKAKCELILNLLYFPEVHNKTVRSDVQPLPPPPVSLTTIILTLSRRILLFEILYAVDIVHVSAEGFYDAWISKVPCSHAISLYSCIHR